MLQRSIGSRIGIAASPSSKRFRYAAGSVASALKLLIVAGLLLGSVAGLEEQLLAQEAAADTNHEASDLDQLPADQAADQPTAPETPAAPKPEPVPILPDANEVALQREVILIALMGVMGIGCTVVAFFAFWMLGKNSPPAEPEGQTKDRREA